jgi:hypothetical protein
MTFLVIADFVDYMAIETRTHYSLTKAFYVALGLGKITKTYYLTTGKTEEFENITLKSLDEIDDDFLDEIDHILIGREPIIDDIFEKSEVLTNLIFNKERKQLIGIKSDSISWMWRNKVFLNKFQMHGFDFVANHIDIIYSQTERFKQLEGKKIPKKHVNNIQIRLSPMGVPNQLPSDNFDTNPYILNTDSYVRVAKQLSENKALLAKPLCEDKKLVKYFIDRKDNKTILIFMGRIKTESGKISLMMRDIMKKLGNDYELHIFPGRFFLPGDVSKQYSPKFNTNIEILRNEVFPDSENIFVHKPYNDKDKDIYLHYADIGIDFSAYRPKNEITPMGHCKLLEYCYYGLKVVADKNIINSYLVEKGKNGILLEGVPNVDDYVDAIKKLKDMDYDRKYAQQQTIEDSNWDKIAKNIYDDFVQFNNKKE